MNAQLGISKIYANILIVITRFSISHKIVLKKKKKIVIRNEKNMNDKFSFLWLKQYYENLSFAEICISTV